MNTCAFLQKAALYRPQQPAIIFGSETITYSEFYQRSLAIAGNFAKLGLKAGDRVAFCLGNSPSILEIIYACFAGGLIVVPINARLHAKEIAYIVGDSSARILIHGSEYQQPITENIESFSGLEHRVCVDPVKGAIGYEELLNYDNSIDEPIDVNADDPCWLFYTSGTTGKPKGATWSHRTIRVVIMNYLADLYNIQPGEMVLHAAPLSHGSGIIALPAIARGATNVIFEKPSFEPKALFALIERLQISHIAFLAPTQIIKMLEEFKPDEYDLSSLQAICYGGAPIHVEHLRRALSTFGSIFTQLYGQGEAPITISGMTASEHDRLLKAGDERIGSTGTIRTDVEVRCVDENGVTRPLGETGEIVVRGEVVMLGYWNKPQATAETIRGGWLYTGDVGLLDEEGYLFLLDRTKDVIISGGNNIYPREVEEVIVEHPKVADAVVIGVPDDYWGEAVHAVLIVEPGESVTEEEIIKYCGNSLAGYKKPKGVDFVSDFPVSAYGKILRREIRDRYWKGHNRAIGGATRVPSQADKS